MDKIPQKILIQMRESLDMMDISPAKRAESSALLDAIEEKGGIAPKEVARLGKLIESEEKQIKEGINSAKQAQKATFDFIKKTDRIFEDYLKALEK